MSCCRSSSASPRSRRPWVRLRLACACHFHGTQFPLAPSAWRCVCAASMRPAQHKGCCVVGHGTGLASCACRSHAFERWECSCAQARRSSPTRRPPASAVCASSARSWRRARQAQRRPTAARESQPAAPAQQRGRRSQRRSSSSARSISSRAWPRAWGRWWRATSRAPTCAACSCSAARCARRRPRHAPPPPSHNAHPAAHARMRLASRLHRPGLACISPQESLLWAQISLTPRACLWSCYRIPLCCGGMPPCMPR